MGEQKSSHWWWMAVFGTMVFAYARLPESRVKDFNLYGKNALRDEVGGNVL